MKSSSRTRSNTACGSEGIFGMRYFGNDAPEIVVEYSSLFASALLSAGLRNVIDHSDGKIERSYRACGAWSQVASSRSHAVDYNRVKKQRRGSLAAVRRAVQR